MILHCILSTYGSVRRYVGVCCPDGQESSDASNAGGLPGSDAAGQLPGIDPGFPDSGPTPSEVRGQCPLFMCLIDVTLGMKYLLQSTHFLTKEVAPAIKYRVFLSSD